MSTQAERAAAHRKAAGLPAHRCPNCGMYAAHWCPDAIDHLGHYTCDPTPTEKAA